MSFFLKTVPVDEAVAVVKKIAPVTGEEQVELEHSLNRVLFRNVSADIDIPGFDRSVVDGYAVHSADTVGAGDSIPAILLLTGQVSMGSETPVDILKPGSCIYVPTGGEVPEGTDAVAMIEYCESIGGEVLVKRPLAPGENLVMKGEDFAAGETVLEKGRVLRAQDLGVLAATGCAVVPVSVMPKVGIISTGNELVPVTDVPTGSRIRDVNSYLCRAFVEENGCIPVLYGIVRDDPAVFGETLERALGECEAVLISGGSSKDERDLTAGQISSRGEVLVHGIALAPGKPTIIGQVRKKPVIGLPGHPASTFIVLLVIVRHLLHTMTGNTTSGPCITKGTLIENIPSAKGREEYVRVKVNEKEVSPLFGKSGLLNTLVRSDGVIRVPSGSEGIEVGDEVEVILW